MRKLSPIVSICCVTYNHERYLKECLEGFVMQKTNFDFEILVHEDASTDKTAVILREFESKYPKLFRCVYQTENQFLKQNTLTNILFPMASGKYIALCEGDDYWTDPLKLQKQVDFLEANSTFNICFHRANIKKENNFKLHKIPEISKNGVYEYIDLLKNYNFITTASVVFRKPENFLIPDWFHKLPFGDLGLYKIVLENKMIKCLDDVMSVYRLHSDGMWSKLDKKDEVDMYLKFYKLIYPILSLEEQLVVTKKTHLILEQNKIENKFKNRFKKVISQLWK